MSEWKQVRLRACCTAVLAGVVTAAGAPVARAVDKNWNVGASTWDTAGAWSPAGKPQAADAADVNKAGALVQYQNPSTIAGSLLRLRVDFAGSAPTFAHSVDNLTTEFTDVGYAGNRIYTHSGGRHVINQINGLVVGWQFGSVGAYELGSGATLTARRGAVIGANGKGVFNQSGGTFAVGPLADAGTLYLGRHSNGEGVLNISGGTLTADGVVVGADGDGTLNHTGGSVVVAGDLRVGESSDQSEYNLSGAASLNTLRTVVGPGGNGLFWQSGGTHHANVEVVVGNLGTGVYGLFGGTLTSPSVSVGSLSQGMMAQLGGTHACSGTLSIGATPGLPGQGMYQLAEGTLSAGVLAVKSGGNFVQQGGTATTGALTLASTAVVELAGGAISTESLSLSAGAVLNLTNQEMLIDYTGATPAVAVRGWLTSGYAGGAWTGTGIRSSTAATAAAGAAYGVGYAEAADVLAFDGMPKAPWLGYVADETCLLVRYTPYGDADLDGAVGFLDLVRVAQNYGGAGKAWSHGDFNYDGVVDFADLAKFAQNYSGVMPSALPGAPEGFGAELAAAFAQVPEPGLSLALGGLFAATLRRRKIS